MKYSKNNKPLACMMTNSTCYKGTNKFAPKGVLWHCTGANNPNLSRYVQPDDNAVDRDEWIKLLGKNRYGNDWNHKYVQAGLNAWIGKLADGTVATVQTMPWEYRPWGCGAGKKGSCNHTHLQFEICEDNLKDKVYFEKAYKEACELTAYLCDMYNIDPYGTIILNGVTVPTILCHYDSHKLGLGSNHGDVYNWFNKHGKTMDDVRRDVAALMKNTTQDAPAQSNQTQSTPAKELYRVRKAWNKPATQKGAFANLNNAKSACDTAGKGYYVFDSNGNVVYPIAQKKSVLEIAKEVISGKWLTGIARKNKLTEAGYDYNEVQSVVNELLGAKTSEKTVEQIAKEVINGKWGNGSTRKKKLEEAGYDYSAVQKKVNELLRK